MKKIFSLLLTIALLLAAVPSVFAAGNAGWNGPSEVRAGDTITLTFYAGGGIYGGSGTVSYDPNQLTLKGYTQSIGGSWALEWGGNSFIFYDNSMASPITGSSSIFQATFVVNANVPVGTQIKVSATGVTLSDGQQDSSIGTVSYSAAIAEPLSDNCNLATLTVTGATISPAFAPSVTSYTATVPFETANLGITATAEDDGATVTVSNPTLTPNATTSIQITVTAENGTKKVYTISVFRAQDPNYVPSSNADLKSLSVSGYSLSPAFSPDVTQYYVWLPYETDSVSISAAVADEKATLTIGNSTDLTPGARRDIAVTVTAEDETQKVYTVTVVRAPAHDQVEDYLSGRVVAPDPEPTTPPETQPDPQPETQPAPEATEPSVTPTTAPTHDQGGSAPRSTGTVLLMCGVSFIAGAVFLCLLASISAQKKRKRG